ncbi:DUF2796 domain-containing protein [Hyphomonas sp. WL0036]|uniref:ZrgA family zinc uptake protein n=1 Tax=Hyphomonas sediminis TaxID=2866160 RepID=UPI001C808E8B|nr:DUF2796 domain-containing protein [Hyphomonas sediminis]MBY9066221.1 DUF2796 domain-containing protein [Hyphomonas sediminis]
MIQFPRLSLPVLAGAAFSLIAACGQSETSAPAASPTETTAAAAAGEAHDDHVHEEEAGHAHEGEGDAHDHHEDHAGGAAHVHGIADLAFVFEGNRLTAEMISPLANFGLSEADGTITEEAKAAFPGLVTVTGGECSAEMPEAVVDTSSGHTDIHLNFVWSCARPGAVTAARFDGFTVFPGFETINAVFIGDTVQKAAELTPSAPEISLK